MEEIESLVKTVAAADVAAEDRLAAFGEIVRRYQDMAYGCAYAILGDFHLAEDAAQEAFLAAYRQLAQLREPKALPGWLRRIVITQCSRMTRGKRVSTTGLDAAATVASGNLQPPEALEKQEMEDKVLSAIRQLPENQRMVTTLFYINGYSQKTIAEFLEVPVTTVKKQLVTARGRLKQRMMKMVDETLKSFPLSDDFADVVVRKAATEADLKGAADLLSYSGRKKPDDFRSPADAEKAGVYIVGEEGSVDGAGYFNETAFSIGSVILKAARPNEMGAEAAGVPDPAFVKGFAGCCKLAKQRGIHLAVAHGSQYDHAFCEFVPCFYYPVATLPCEAAKPIVTRATITEADEKEQETARQACLRDPYAPKMSAYIGGGVWHIIKQDGAVVGYVRVNRDFDPAKKCDMPFGFVTDVTMQTRDAALAVIRLGAELAAAAGQAEICMMQSHMTRITQAMLALGGTYVLRGSCDLVGLDAEMVAIIDLPGLTKDLEGEFQSRFRNSALSAAFSIETGGQIVGFVAKADRLEIVTKKQRVHRPLPRWVTTRLYTGYYSGEDVLAMGPIPADRSDGRTPDDVKLDNKQLEMPETETALFAELFPKLWPVSWPDPDVWPWVIGREHPKYQDAQAKTPEMKAQIDSLRFPWIGY